MQSAMIALDEKGSLHIWEVKGARSSSWNLQRARVRSNPQPEASSVRLTHPPIVCRFPPTEDGTTQHRPIGMAAGRSFGSGSAELFAVPLVSSAPLDVTLDRTKGKGRPSLFFVGGDGHLKELRDTEAGGVPLWRDVGPVPARHEGKDGLVIGFLPPGGGGVGQGPGKRKPGEEAARDALPVIADAHVRPEEPPSCSPCCCAHRRSLHC